MYNTLLFSQGELTQWVDGSSLTFTKWSARRYRAFPFAIFDCQAHGCQYKQTVDEVLHDALRTPQPHTTENNTRLCSALVYTQKPPQWIMIPCNKNMGLAIQICETMQVHVNNNNNNIDLLDPDSDFIYEMRYVESMYIGTADAVEVSSYVFEQTRGSVNLYTDFSRVMSSSTCGLYCHIGQPQIRNWPFCRDGWIMSQGLCFKLFSKITRYAKNILQNLISECIFNGRFIKINATYLTHSSILDYLVKWTITENQTIHVLDDINEDINEYKCRNFKIGESYNDFYALDPNKLEESLDDQLTCAWKYIDEILCVQEPMISQDSCPEGTYKCRDQSCISESYRCDTQYDCPDGDDEYNCTYEWSFMNHPPCINQLIITGEEFPFHCDCIAVSLVCIYMFTNS